jgi:hypothetical protein
LSDIKKLLVYAAIAPELVKLGLCQLTILDHAREVPLDSAKCLHEVKQLLAGLCIIDSGGLPRINELLVEVLERLDKKFISQERLSLAARSCLSLALPSFMSAD